MCYQYLGVVLGNETGGIRKKIGILSTRKIPIGMYQNNKKNNTPEQCSGVFFFLVFLLQIGW
jgi:hypothetical protein